MDEKKRQFLVRQMDYARAMVKLHTKHWYDPFTTKLELDRRIHALNLKYPEQVLHYSRSPKRVARETKKYLEEQEKPLEPLEDFSYEKYKDLPD